MSKTLYKRVLIKFSGEFFAKGDGYQNKNKNFPGEILKSFVSQLQDIKKSRVETAVVVGAGNIIRGLNAEKSGLDRYTSDYMGMIATMINALHLKIILSQSGIPGAVMSSLEVKKICPGFSKDEAQKLLGRGEVLILAGGTGNPYFTTDTAAALKAIELDADVLLKATKVDGVYDSDPMINTGAKKFERLTYQQAIEKNLRVMDMTAISLCRENSLPILVFDINKPCCIKKILKGEKVGTIIN